MKKNILLIFFAFVASVVNAQDQTIDSLQKLLLTQNDDTNKVKTLYKLTRNYTANDSKVAMLYADSCNKLAQKINWKKGIAMSYYALAIIYRQESKYDIAHKYSNGCYQIYKSINNKNGMADAYLSIANNYEESGYYTKAIENNFLALKLYEEVKNKRGMGMIYGNMGNSYYHLLDYPKALENYLKGLAIVKELNNEFAVASGLDNIASVYLDEKKYDSSAVYNLQAIEIFKKLDDQPALARIYYNRGNLFLKQNDLISALDYFNESLEISKKLDLKKDKAYAYEGMGDVYFAPAKEGITNFKMPLSFNKGKSHLLQNARINYYDALNISTEIGNINLMMTIAKSLAETEEILGNYKKANTLLRTYYQLKDSIFNAENNIKIARLESDRNLALKDNEIQLLNKDKAIKESEIKRQAVVRNVIVAGIIVFLIFIFFLFRNYNRKRKMAHIQSMLNERLRISRELHDDMGSTLSSISVYSEVAKNRAIKNENETEVLQKIGNASRELIEKMSDIVWSLNPNNENFEQLKNRMMAFAAMMLTPKGILFEFEIDDEVKSKAIAPEQRKNIFLIYKEAINNIVKYSEATSVKVKVKARPNVDSYGRVKENKLSLEVIDNGKGFDTNKVEAYNGNGLKNMKARAEEIKALFNVSSRINEGTGIELSFKI